MRGNMAVQFTKQQQKAIDLQQHNILVSAAAGSGKTAVLSERIVQMVCRENQPVDIDRLLVVTFTNAAAMEMRERIAAGITKMLEMEPRSEHIQKQMTLLHNAQITTIDSFSLFLIRNHFNEIGLDPAFRVADEGEIKLLRRDVLGEMLEDAFAGASEDAPGFVDGEDFHNCVEYFCPGGKEGVLEQHILNLSQYAASFSWPEEWLAERKADYSRGTVEALLTGSYGIYLKEHISHMLEGCIEKLLRAKQICESPDGPYMYGELLEQEIECLEKICPQEGLSLTEYAEKIFTISFGRLPSKKDETVSPLKRELVKSLRSEVKDTIQKMEEEFFATPLALAAAQEQKCAAPVAVLIDLVLEFDRRMKEKKQEKKIIDFSDMEHYALEILLQKDGGGKRVPSPVALEYRQYFYEILIDEYQDSNQVQEDLLRAISGEEEGHFNRFMVGDVKQSIYQFRLARPELFLEKYQNYGEEGNCRRIDLSQNFRSRIQVVDTVNALFSRMMSNRVGHIDYDERAALYPGAVYPKNNGCESEFLLVEKPKKEDAAKQKDLTVRQAEALAIAHKIKSLKADFQVTDKVTGQLRPASYGDMVILLRTTSGWDEEFKAVLEEEGIPVYINSKTGYFAASEVQTLLQLLRVLDNPRQDIPLFGVMKSLFGGFTEEEIAEIIGKNPESGLLYEAVQNTAGEETPLAEKCAGFLAMLDAYRDMTVYLPIRNLLQKITEDFHYLDYVTALPAGSRRRANVEMLFTKASDFEKTSYFGLFHFVRYMEQLEKYDVDYGEADSLDENADVVRIMSIHKSKGLEFPIVFVAGLAKRFNMQDTSQSLIVDMDYGLACDYVEPVRRIRNKTLRYRALSKKMREDSLSEELRVLYVALTRAGEKLILSAVIENAAEKWELKKAQESASLTYADFMEAGNCLDFLMPILPRCPIEVQIVNTGDLVNGEVKEQIQLSVRRAMLELAESYGDKDMRKSMEERFAYQYPYRNMADLYTKTTVSELKIAAMADKDEAAFHAFEEREVLPYIPSFGRKEEKISGTVRGNAYHRAMELLDFEAVLGGQFEKFPQSFAFYQESLDRGRLRKDLKNFLEREIDALRLPQEYFEALNLNKLVHFLDSSLAYRMWSADRRGELYREQPFVLGIEAGRLNQEFPSDEKVLIQGIIDVFFVEDGQLVLLDYKTDAVASMEELKNRYEVQLDYYEEALRKLQQLPVKEKLLYSFHLERA
ncbi:MAG: helicase-exonuclease AddAB subunit AddA [Lachnoclostridium sp.]|nr:helicase-exonuclease AddAB subunit AddA [Lachnoclostridium sp.]MCM1536179.1 helicase-exonuclease AddAB subunit AddA [Clostridium sp.]